MTPESRQIPLHHVRFGPQSPLSAEDEQDLAARKEAGDASARETLILSNIPLAISRANSFATGSRRTHLDILISAALTALVECVDGYRPGVLSDGAPVRLGTYAARSINRRIVEATYREIPTIPAPHWVMRYARRGGRPGAGEGRPAKSFGKCHARAQAALGCQGEGEAGLDRGLGMESVPAGAAPEPSRWTPDVCRAISKLVGHSESQAEVIRLMYPMDGSDPLELAEVAERLGVKRQTVVATRRRALRNLRKILGEMEAAA